MKKIFFGITLAALAASAFAQPYATWSKSRDVSVNTTALSVFEAVANFPLLVRLSNAGPATGSDVLADDATGASLRFASADGNTPLSFEIEQWGPAAAAIWVKVPGIAPSATTTIRMYWGKDTTSASSGAAVFDTAGGFQAVYHLNDANNANATDATLNAYHATPGGTGGNPVSVAGPIGGAKDFLGSGTANNTTGSYYTIPGTNAVAPKLNFDAVNGPYTLSAWVRVDNAPTGTGGAQRMGVVMKYGANTIKQYMLGFVGNAASPSGRWSGNHMTSSGEAWHEGDATIQVWQHIATVRSGPGVGTGQGGAGMLYVDGAPANFNPTGSGTNTGNGTGGDLFIGSYSDPVRYLDGQIDEVVLSSTARNADWIALSHATQRPDQTTVTLGTTTGVLGSSAAGYAGTAFGAAPFGRGLSFQITGAAPAAKAAVSVLDMRGRLVWIRTVALNGGSAQFAWDGNTAGGQAASGIYAARVTLLDANGKVLRTLERKVPLTR